MTYLPYQVYKAYASEFWGVVVHTPRISFFPNKQHPDTGDSREFDAPVMCATMLHLRRDDISWYYIRNKVLKPPYIQWSRPPIRQSWEFSVYNWEFVMHSCIAQAHQTIAQGASIYGSIDAFVFKQFLVFESDEDAHGGYSQKWWWMPLARMATLSDLTKLEDILTAIKPLPALKKRP